MDARPIFPYNWLEPPYLEEPYPLYARARREAPVFYSPLFDIWAITRYHDVRAAVMDPQRFSAAYLIRTPLNPSAEVQAVLNAGYPEIHMLVNQDPPGHTRTRSLVNKAFTPQRVQLLKPRIQALTEHLIDRFVDDGSVDIIAHLAYPLPMAVIADLIGLPTEDLDHIKHWTEDVLLLNSPEITRERQLEAAHGTVAFQRYLEMQIKERQRVPRDDLLTSLLHAHLEGEHPLSIHELINLLMVLIFAGHETTTNLIGNMLLLVLNQPAVWQAIHADARLAAEAVEESLRMDAPVQAMFRTTTAPVELSGVQLPVGARTLLLFASANRDEAVFPDPDRFDLHRPNKDQHLSFGRGIHFCLGAMLARLEAQTVLTTLAQRLPNLRMDPDHSRTYLPNFIHRGPRQLHVIWEPGQNHA